MMAQSFKRPGRKPEPRSLCAIVSINEGLEQCTSPWDLVECVLHAILGGLGWLNYYQSGFLHRDIGTSNILKLKVPVTHTPFTARLVQSLLTRFLVSITEAGDNEPHPAKRPNFGDSVEETSMRQTITGEEHHDAFWVNLLSNTESSDDAQAVVNEARQVEEELKKLGLGQECKAILNDCDMAAQIHGYFPGRHEDSLSGTYEFMSSSMRMALRRKITYTHSPIDDFHSFFWTTLWAVVNNAHTKSASDTERQFQEMLQTEERDSLINDIQWLASSPQESSRKGISKFFETSLPMLDNWWTELYKLNREWYVVWIEGDESPSPEGKELVFHRFAYRVGSTYLKLLNKHKKRLQEPLDQ